MIIVTCIMRSHKMKDAARGLFGEDSRKLLLILLRTQIELKAILSSLKLAHSVSIDKVEVQSQPP